LYQCIPLIAAVNLITKLCLIIKELITELIKESITIKKLNCYQNIVGSNFSSILKYAFVQVFYCWSEVNGGFWTVFGKLERNVGILLELDFVSNTMFIHRDRVAHIDVI